ncbi:MAG: hypothetical protein ACE5E2_06450 [Candidatus Binatia bacterium]
MYSWSASPALQKIYESLDEQRRIIDHLKVYLEERLVPFQCHLAEHQRNVDQALRHMQSRLVPLRQYIQGEHQNLERVAVHLQAGLREQFGTFERFLAKQSDLIEQADQYLEKQPRPLQNYLEDERQAIEIIYRDLVEQRLDRLLQNFLEQQKIVESFCAAEVISEYESLAEYLDERQKAFERYVRSAEFRPAQYFAQLDEVASRYKPLDPGQGKLFARVFKKTRLADEKFRKALSVPVPSPPKHPKKRRRISIVPSVPSPSGEVPVSLNGDCVVETITITDGNKR